MPKGHQPPRRLDPVPVRVAGPASDGLFRPTGSARTTLDFEPRGEGQPRALSATAMGAGRARKTPPSRAEVAPPMSPSGTHRRGAVLTDWGEGLMGPVGDFSHIPIVDVSDLVAGTSARRAVAERLGEACRESGFFYVVGHGVDEALQDRLRDLSRRVLRAGPGDQAADPHGPGRPGLAGLLPRRRRADLRQAGPEGGPLLRRGAARRTTRGSWPARRSTAPTSSRPSPRASARRCSSTWPRSPAWATG